MTNDFWPGLVDGWVDGEMLDETIHKLKLKLNKIRGGVTKNKSESHYRSERKQVIASFRYQV